MSTPEKPQTPEGFYIPVLDIGDYGVNDFFAPDAKNILGREIQKRFPDSLGLGEFAFKIPDTVGGFMRVVSQQEFESVLAHKDTPAAYEYYVVRKGEPQSIVPPAVRLAVHHPTEENSQAVYVPKEQIVRFNPAMQFHENFSLRAPMIKLVRSSKLSPNVWSWKNIQGDNWTDIVKNIPQRPQDY